MGVHNTIDILNTLFIYFATLIGITVYRLYRQTVGKDTDNADNNEPIANV